VVGIDELNDGVNVQLIVTIVPLLLIVVVSKHDVTIHGFLIFVVIQALLLFNIDSNILGL